MAEEEERNLKLISRTKGRPLVFKWPLIKTELYDEGVDIVEMVRLVLLDMFDEQLANNVVPEDIRTDDYDVMSDMCSRYKKLITEWKKAFGYWDSMKTKWAPKEAAKSILARTYARSVIHPRKLNKYQSFSPKTYGETGVEIVEQMLDRVKLKPTDTVIDLGSGIGQVVLQIAVSVNVSMVTGIECADIPAGYAKAMGENFKMWMDWSGFCYSPFQLLKDDFTLQKHQPTINKASLVFTNNYVFGPELNNKLRRIFQEQEGRTVIVASSSLVLNNKERVNRRNMHDLDLFLDTKSIPPIVGEVSWTVKKLAFVVHVFDFALAFERRSQFLQQQKPQKGSSKRNNTHTTTKENGQLEVNDSSLGSSSIESSESSGGVVAVEAVNCGTKKIGRPRKEAKSEAPVASQPVASSVSGSCDSLGSPGTSDGENFGDVHAGEALEAVQVASNGAKKKGRPRKEAKSEAPSTSQPLASSASGSPHSSVSTGTSSTGSGESLEENPTEVAASDGGVKRRGQVGRPRKEAKGEAPPLASSTLGSCDAVVSPGTSNAENLEDVLPVQAWETVEASPDGGVTRKEAQSEAPDDSDSSASSASGSSDAWVFTRISGDETGENLEGVVAVEVPSDGGAKKKGRPRKEAKGEAPATSPSSASSASGSSDSSMSTRISDDETSENLEGVVAVEALEAALDGGAKKRGRPRKEAKSEAPPLASSPKKRGRPRKEAKSKPQLKSHPVASSAPGSHDSGENGLTLLAADGGPKKKGRPRKEGKRETSSPSGSCNSSESDSSSLVVVDAEVIQEVSAAEANGQVGKEREGVTSEATPADTEGLPEADNLDNNSRASSIERDASMARSAEVDQVVEDMDVVPVVRPNAAVGGDKDTASGNVSAALPGSSNLDGKNETSSVESNADSRGAVEAAEVVADQSRSKGGGNGVNKLPSSVSVPSTLAEVRLGSLVISQAPNVNQSGHTAGELAVKEKLAPEVASTGKESRKREVGVGSNIKIQLVLASPNSNLDTSQTSDDGQIEYATTLVAVKAPEPVTATTTSVLASEVNPVMGAPDVAPAAPRRFRKRALSEGATWAPSPNSGDSGSPIIPANKGQTGLVFQGCDRPEVIPSKKANRATSRKAPEEVQRVAEAAPEVQPVDNVVDDLSEEDSLQEFNMLFREFKERQMEKLFPTYNSVVLRVGRPALGRALQMAIERAQLSLAICNAEIETHVNGNRALTAAVEERLNARVAKETTVKRILRYTQVKENCEPQGKNEGQAAKRKQASGQPNSTTRSKKRRLDENEVELPNNQLGEENDNFITESVKERLKFPKEMYKDLLQDFASAE